MFLVVWKDATLVRERDEKRNIDFLGAWRLPIKRRY